MIDNIYWCLNIWQVVCSLISRKLTDVYKLSLGYYKKNTHTWPILSLAQRLCVFSESWSTNSSSLALSSTAERSRGAGLYPLDCR